MTSKQCFKCFLWQQKKGDCWLAFCLFLCEFQEKIETSWRNYLTWIADRGGEHNTPDTLNTLVNSLSAIAIMQEILWTEDEFANSKSL